MEKLGIDVMCTADSVPMDLDRRRSGDAYLPHVKSAGPLLALLEIFVLRR